MAETSEDIKRQVEASIAKVQSARDRALVSLELSNFAIFPQFSSEADAIKGMDPVKVAWEKRGRDSAKAGTAPGTKGWTGWTQGGQELINGYQTSSKSAGLGLLSDITTTAKEAPKTTVQAAKKAAAVAGQVAASVGDAVGSVGATLKWVGIGAVVIVVGLAALKFGPSR